MGTSYNHLSFLSNICLFYLSILLSLFPSYFVSADSLVLHPNPVSSLSLRENYNGTALIFSADDNGEFAYVSGGKAGSFIISLKNPQFQEVISQIPGTHVQDVLRRGNYLFVSDQFSGASIYNVTDIKNPVFIVNLKSYAPQVQASIVTNDGKYLYVLNNGKVHSFDLTDITKPVLIATTGVVSPYSYRLKFNIDESFITVSNHLYGIQIVDIRNKGTPKLRANKNPSFVSWDSVFTKDTKILYAVDIYFGLFAADVSSMSATDPSSDNLFDLSFDLIYYAKDLEFMSIYLTKDNSHLLLGFRSIGIYLFSVDPTNYKSITFVQHLQASYMTLSIMMPRNNESLLLATNGVAFLIYSVVSPNLNQDFPNFLNTFQSNLIPKILPLVVPSVYCMKDDKHIIAMNLQDRWTIYNAEDGYTLEEVSSVNRAVNQGYLSQAEVSSDSKYLYVTSSGSGILTYNIQTKSSPSYVSTYTPLDPPYNQALTLRLDPTNSFGVVANSFYGVQYVVVAGPTTLITDKQRIICSCREIGVFFFQFENPPFLTLKSIFREIGSEAAIVSANEKILYAGLGFQGIYIVDISDFSQPKRIGRLILKGWVQFLRLLFNEKYLVVSQLDKGQLALVNIEDPQNPYVHQLAEFQDEDSSSVCVPPSGKSMYFIGNNGLRNLKIVTDLKIHTQIQVAEHDENGTFTFFNTLGLSDHLQVGQVAYLTFVPLYTQKTVTITSVKYYRYFEKQTLPSWMTYLPAKRQIYMTVDKTAVMNEFSTEMKGENIIILEILIQLSASDFELKDLIDSTLAAYLFSVLKKQGYLNYYGNLTDKLDSNGTFNLDFYDATYTEASFGSNLPKVQSHIKKVLVFSKYDYPIRFFVKSSMRFALKSSRMLGDKTTMETTERNLLSSGSVLSTPSKQITVFMQILKNGKFVKKTFEGVLASFADDLSSVRISGQTNYVNSILEKNIQISNSTVDLSKVTMSVIVQDSSNFDMEIATSLEELEFVSFHKPVEINPNKSLTSQLENIYPQGDIPVEQRFQFSFDLSSFTQADSLPIYFSAFIVNSDGSQTEISTGLWIEFNSQSLGFSGFRTIGYLRDTSTIKIVASDSYSSTSSTFNIQFRTVPFFYIIQLGVSIIGPLLGVLGLWKYRHEIHLFVSERRNMYKDEVAIIGQMYEKQIVLFSQIQSDGDRLMKQYLKANPKFIEEMNTQYVQVKSVNMTSIMSSLEQFYQPIQSQFPNIDPREFDFDDSRLVRVIKRILYEHLIERDQNTKNAFHELKKFAIKNQEHHKDWYKRYIQIRPLIQTIGNQVVRNKSDNAQFQQTDAQIKETLPMVKHIYSMSNSKIGGIELPEVVVSQRNTEQPLLPNSPTIVFPTSSRHAAVLSHHNNEMDESEYFNGGAENNQNNDLQQTQQLKEHNAEDKNEHQKDQFIDLNPFPEMNVSQHVIEETLRSIEFRLNYDFHLLAETIALEASGLLPTLPGKMNPAVGESIHVSAHDLFTLQAFRRNKIGFVQKVLQFFNMAYTPIGLVRNNPVPKWLNYQIVDGIVNLWGVPTLSDESEILIRIINNMLITVYSFRILIQDKDRNDIRDMNLLRKVTQKLGKQVKPRNKTMNLAHSSINIFYENDKNNQMQFNQHPLQKSEIYVSGDLMNSQPQQLQTKQISKEDTGKQAASGNNNTPRNPLETPLKMSTILKGKIEEISEQCEESPIQPQIPREFRYLHDEGRNKIVPRVGDDEPLKEDSIIMSLDGISESQSAKKPPVKLIKSLKNCE